VRRWYAVQCRSREDARAETQLLNQLFHVFRPLARVRKRRRGRAATVIESLFPRYLFIELDNIEDNWAPIRSTRGVVDLVRFGDRAVAAPERMIVELKARTDADGCVNLAAERDYRRNECVHIIDGPFAGLDALFLERRGTDRVIILLNIMQQAQRLVLPECAIETA
jgi:transcriptional antiterminator RfaH